MKHEIYTALVTPFNEDYSIDFISFKKLIDYFHSLNHHHFVLAGTTGEGSLLKQEEINQLYDYIKDDKVILMVQGYDYHEVMKQINEDHRNIYAYMVIVPYYLLPSDLMVYKYFYEILKHTTKNIIIYNIPKRVGVDISDEVLIELMKEYHHLIGIKDASNRLERYTNLKKYRNDFKIYCGNDDLYTKALKYPIDGLISVSSHLIYKELEEYTRLYEKGIIDYKLKSKIDFYGKLCFVENNPACIKYLLSMENMIKEVVRLPLNCISQTSKEYIYYQLKERSKN